MHPDYGKQIGTAFAAIRQLHHDVSRLLSDVAPKLGVGRTNETAVIKGTSWQLHSPDAWMPYWVCLTSTGGALTPAEVEYLMVLFWNEPPRPQEPHLIAARVRRVTSTDGKAVKADLLDPWRACFEWTSAFPVGVVNRFTPPNNDRIESVAVTAVPLFSITSVDDVLKLLETVRERAAVA